MKNRNYTKLFVNKNREEGSDKITLGYQIATTDIVLKKDEFSYFHIPAKTTSVSIHESGLIQSGATGGSFPAASDRIFKSRRNYANVTPYGDPTEVPDGTWYCSWLYKSPGGFLQWMDRIYNPGYMYNPQLALTGIYVNNDPLIKDVPSIMVFEPGLLYKYYHVGEKTIKDTIKSFGGLDNESLVLDLSEMQKPLTSNSTPILDQPKIFTTASEQELFTKSLDADRPEKTALDFNNEYTTEIFLDYDEKYIPSDEFTLSFWAQSPSWNTVPTTQLAGSYSSKGGVGVFVEHLESHPFFVIPETNYGHVLYINENLNGFLDKSVQEIPKKSTSSAFTTIDADYNVIVCIDDQTGTVYKIDNAGQIIASSKQTEIPFNFVYANETPLELLVGESNSIIIRTQRGIYTLDAHLNKTTQLMLSSSSKDVCSYSYNTETNRAELILTKNSIDSKFIGTTQWSISADGNLYKTTPGTFPELFHIFNDKATNLSIDPNENIWILHGTNRVSIITNPMASTPLEVTPVKRQAGKDVNHENKNLNFTYVYDRKTKTRTWYGVVYYSNEEYIYILDSQGNSKKVLDIYSLFDSNLVTALEQNYEKFKFLGKGDFTGYEHRRVFRKLLPYDNKSQLALRISLKNRSKQVLSFDQFVIKTPIDWNDNSWQHFALTMKQQTFSLYVNGILHNTFTYSGRHELSYELGPSFYIGTSGGSQSGYNREIQCPSQLFNGLISDIKIYNYSIDPKNFECYLREFITADDLVWAMPIPSLEYIEKIERVFQNKIPGSKSPMFKVKIRGSGIEDEHTKKIVNEQVQNTIESIQPAYTDLLKIDWIK